MPSTRLLFVTPIHCSSVWVRLTPPTVVAAMSKEEEAGHVIVTKAKEVVEAGSATMTKVDEAQDVIYGQEKEKI